METDGREQPKRAWSEAAPIPKPVHLPTVQENGWRHMSCQDTNIE